MRRFCLQPALARLALLAMLLLAALPTAGRFAASSRAESGWSGVCTRAGLQWVRPGDRGAPAIAHDGDDCAYCPLLQALDAPVVAPAFTAMPAMRFAFAVQSSSSRSGETPTFGLGARGPPRIRYTSA